MLVEQLRASHDGAPGIERLTGFVARYIEKKNLARGDDVASVVAARKEGDCSEHAVLLAALARAFAIPARVVHGLVLAPIDGRVQGFGHARVEVHDGKTWRPADAALFEGPPRAYLPMYTLGNEGVGFRVSLMSGASVHHVRRIVLEKTGQ